MAEFDPSPEAVKARYDDYLSCYGDDYRFQLMTVLAEEMFYKLKEEMEHIEHIGGSFKYRADYIREAIEPILETEGLAT